MTAANWNQVLQVVSLFASGITITACILYFRRARSAASVGMLVGVFGGFVVNVTLMIANMVMQQWILHPTPDPNMAAVAADLQARAVLYTWVVLGIGVVGLAFGLVFAISLFIVLRDAGRRLESPLREPDAEEAPGPA